MKRVLFPLLLGAALFACTPMVAGTTVAEDGITLQLPSNLALDLTSLKFVVK